jgi:integration host factor subunit beta
MLKSDLILFINKNYSSLSHNDIELIVDFFFKKIVESLKEGKNLEIRGFGTFSKKINKEKYVRNPKTNEKIFKKQNYKVHFKIGKILHQRINSVQ